MDECCVVCGGPPAGLYFAVPPGDRVQQKANGQTLIYVVCAACQDRTGPECVTRDRRALGGE